MEATRLHTKGEKKMKLNEKEQRFHRMFPPRMKQLDKQIRLVQNCSRKDGYEWGFTDLVPTFFIVILKDLTLCAKNFDLDIDVTIGGRNIEDIYDDACEKLNEHNAD